MNPPSNSERVDIKKNNIQQLPLNQPQHNMVTNQVNPSSTIILVNPDMIPLDKGFVPIIEPKQFGSVPITTYCPFCRIPITTVVKKKCNCVSCLCLYCECCCWVMVQTLRNKDMSCYDATHTCPRCGNIIGNYNSW